MDSKNQLQKLIKLFTTFSTHFTIFIVTNIIFWGIWLFSQPFSFYSLPFYVSAVWFVILAIHCLVAYQKFKTKNTV